MGEAVRSIVSLLRAGGQALISVWALEQERHKVKSKYIAAKRDSDNHQNEETATNHSSKEDVAPTSEMKVHKNRTSFQAQDLFVPWHLKKDSKSSKDELVEKSEPAPVYHRFYHVFQEGELEELCLSLNNVQIVLSYYDQ